MDVPRTKETSAIESMMVIRIGVASMARRVYLPAADCQKPPPAATTIVTAGGGLLSPAQGSLQCRSSQPSPATFVALASACCRLLHALRHFRPCSPFLFVIAACRGRNSCHRRLHHMVLLERQPASPHSPRLLSRAAFVCRCLRCPLWRPSLPFAAFAGCLRRRRLRRLAAMTSYADFGAKVRVAETHVDADERPTARTRRDGRGSGRSNRSRSMSRCTSASKSGRRMWKLHVAGEELHPVADKGKDEDA